MIYFCSPYRSDKDLGKAYNEYIKLLPDNSWICITDYDSMFLSPESCSVIEQYTNQYPDTGLFTCYTNRIHAGQKDQLYKGMVSDESDILHHVLISNKLIKEPLSIGEIRHNISGVLMLFNKDTWAKVGGFKEGVGCLGVDVDFSRRIKEIDLPVVRMNTVYIFHYYRMLNGVIDKTHLSINDKTVYTALFGNYEKLKEPRVKTPGWIYVCFTDQPIESKHWEVVVVKRKFDCPRTEARWYKANAYKVINTRFSMWVDASFIIRCNLNNFWKKWFKLPFSSPKHPARKCVYEEIQSVINAKRGGRELILEQGEHYKQIGIPSKSGVITSGVILREHTDECNRLCDEWWEQTSKWSKRDQVSFAAVQGNYKDIIHNFGWAYNTAQDLKYIKHHDPINR